MLGDRLEAAVLRAATADGREHEARLPDNAVFEDLKPRIVALDRQDTILVVRSTHSAGAALVACRPGATRLEEVAATPAIGAPNRWLNPIGVADFDGDGRAEVALVRHPHVGGVLKIYSLAGGRFAESASRPGFSNHDLGSTQLDLHAIGDFDGDGIADLAGADRTSLHLVGFAGRNLRGVAMVANPAVIAGPVLVVDLDGNPRDDLVYLLADGTVSVILR